MHSPSERVISLIKDAKRRPEIEQAMETWKSRPEQSKRLLPTNPATYAGQMILDSLED